MPYKNPKVQRQYRRNYQREWHRKRKKEFFSDKQCAICGSTKDLQLGNREPDSLHSITGGTNPWSLSKRRFAELVEKHVVIRCTSCQRSYQGTYRRDKGPKGPLTWSTAKKLIGQQRNEECSRTNTA
jgi:hypothetical protein